MLSRLIISIFILFENIYLRIFKSFKQGQSALRSPEFSEVRERAIATLCLILIIRIGTFLPIPGTGVNFDLESFQQNSSRNELANILNLLSGGGFLEIGFFTLGILPYMNASFFLQVLTKILPSLERFQKEQEEIAQRQFKEWTRYLTVVWALIQSIAIAWIWIRPYALNWDLFLGCKVVTALTLGAVIVMIIAEQITELGLTNGSSLLIFINIIARIPASIEQLLTSNINWTPQIIFGLVLSLSLSFITMFVVIGLQESGRPVPVLIARQEAERQKLNEKLTEEERREKQAYIFFQLLPAGIMPIIFASTIFDLALPAFVNFLIQQGPRGYQLIKLIPYNPILKDICYIITIMLFSSNYAITIMINPKNLAENLNSMNTLIPGVRPGSDTKEYAERIINRLNFIGSFILALVCILPSIVERSLHLPKLQILSPVSISIAFGVAVDTTRRIISYLNPSSSSN
uniref:Preprotein translocase subunit SecY n=1 Tax=Cyanophora biloba TaxID=1489483 RepID=A0A2Z4HGA7_9EUKA|nr:preprotein translocase subunit SecY [Cyanophora biloba]AWW13772.1 preprotein translocase subunit SecY [Cyanophora biloba]